MKDLVIIINGAGTNNSELKSLAKKLASNEQYFVFYPGIMPGAFVGNYFPKSRTRDFIEFMDSLDELIQQPEFRNVYLIGYSLGAATAAIIAARSPRITKLILIAPIIKNPNYRKFIRGLTRSLAHSKHLTRIQQIFFSEFIKRFMRVPKIHILHMEVYFNYTRRYLKMIDKPTLVIETLQDELVKRKSIDYIEKNMQHPYFRRFPVESSHFLFFDRNVRNEVIAEIESFLEEEIQ